MDMGAPATAVDPQGPGGALHVDDLAAVAGVEEGGGFPRERDEPGARRCGAKRIHKGHIMSSMIPLLLSLLAPAEAEALPRADGYSGIWYMNQLSKDKYVYKYSGGMATYPQQHAPIAIYAK